MEPSRPPRSPLVSPGGIDHHVADMTATFSADVTLQQAGDALAERGQWLPLDGGPNQTLGELAAINSTGPLRLTYGAWRDIMLGCQFLNHHQELITVGGRTVKNVAGYDVTKLMVGQMGALGRLVTVTTRTYKTPEQAMIAEFPIDPILPVKLLPSEVCPQWMLRIPGGMLAGWLGDANWIDFAEARLPAYGAQQMDRVSLEEEAGRRQAYWRTAVSDPSLSRVRASVPPADLDAVLSEGIAGDNATADPVFGIILTEIEPDRVDALRKRCTALGGGARVIDGVGAGLVTPADAHRRELVNRLIGAFGGSVA